MSTIGKGHHYKDYFAENISLVDKIDDIVHREKTLSKVSRTSQLDILKDVKDNIVFLFNIGLTNTLNSVLKSAEGFIYELKNHKNDKIFYYVMVYFAAESLIKNCLKKYRQNHKLSVYYRLVLILLINNSIPGFIDYILLKIAKEVPILKGLNLKNEPQGKLYDLANGFKYLNGARETYEDYDDRMGAYSYIFFMLMTLKLEDGLHDTPDEEKHINNGPDFKEIFKSKASYSWMFWEFVEFYLKQPVQINTSHILTGLYYSAVYEQRRDFNWVLALMKRIDKEIIPELVGLSYKLRDKKAKIDLRENKLRFLINKVKMFYQQDREGMRILTPVEESKMEEWTFEEQIKQEF